VGEASFVIVIDARLFGNFEWKDHPGYHDRGCRISWNSSQSHRQDACCTGSGPRFAVFGSGGHCVVFQEIGENQV
jgi:hypothetical protein